MYQQVLDMGYEVALAYDNWNKPWCEDQSLLWDTDHCFNHALWDKFEEQFVYNNDCDTHGRKLL